MSFVGISGLIPMRYKGLKPQPKPIIYKKKFAYIPERMRSGVIIWLKPYYKRIEIISDLTAAPAGYLYFEIVTYSEKLTPEETTFRKLAEDL